MCNKQTIPATHRGTLQRLPRETVCENDFIRVESASQNQKIELISHTWIILDRDIFTEISRWCLSFFCSESCFSLMLNLAHQTKTPGENHVSPKQLFFLISKIWRSKALIQQWHLSCFMLCFKLTPNIEHASLIWAEEPPTACSKPSIQIMSEHWEAWPLIWSQTHQDKQGKMLWLSALILTSWCGNQRRECVALSGNSAHRASSSIFPGSTRHLLWRALTAQAELSESFGAGAEIQTWRYWTLHTAPRDISYRMRANMLYVHMLFC